MGWVHASERLSLLHLGKASRGNAKVKTGIGKSDLPGLQGGPRKRDLVIYDKVRASRLYPDHVRFCERPVVQSRRPTHPVLPAMIGTETGKGPASFRDATVCAKVQKRGGETGLDL